MACRFAGKGVMRQLALARVSATISRLHTSGRAAVARGEARRSSDDTLKATETIDEAALAEQRKVELAEHKRKMDLEAQKAQMDVDYAIRKAKDATAAAAAAAAALMKWEPHVPVQLQPHSLLEKAFVDMAETDATRSSAKA